MNLQKLCNALCAIVFVVLLLVGAIGAERYINPTLAVILPNIILMAFGTLGLLIQFIFINLHLMSLHKENK